MYKDIKYVILTGTLVVIAGVIGILSSWYGSWEEFGGTIKALGVMSAFLGLIMVGGGLALMLKELVVEQKYVAAVLLVIMTLMIAIGIVVFACIFI